MKKNIKFHEKLKRGISQEYSSSYKQATAQAKITLLLKQKQDNNNDHNIITGMKEGQE